MNTGSSAVMPPTSKIILPCWGWTWPRWCSRIPPITAPNAGHVTGREGVREFAMAHGEMTSEQFVAFLKLVFANILGGMIDGAVAYFCMDWRHLLELWAAAEPIFGKPKNLTVGSRQTLAWASFYRSQHETIPSTRRASRSTISGWAVRAVYRTNVWKYPGFNSFRPRP